MLVYKGVIAENKSQTIRKVLTMMPMANRIVTKYLISFLQRVTQKSEVNKMTPDNLAIVFCPNLLKSRNGDILSQMVDTERCKDLIVNMIEHYSDIFKVIEKKTS